MKDCAPQCAGAKNIRPDRGISLASTYVDRCAIEQFSVDIRRARPTPLDPWCHAQNALAFVSEDRSRLFDHGEKLGWFGTLGRRVFYLFQHRLAQIEEFSPTAVRGPTRFG
jgi:hypothetical protein